MSKKFENIISIGFFCSVSLELEKIGVRHASYPFDWVIYENFERVCELVQNNFDSFMENENLFQEYEINPKYYFDKKYQIHFYHDFLANASLESQLEKVKSKYQRRIDRFSNDIKKPTLFIRYVSNDCEVNYIKENHEFINTLYKTFNPKNEVVYITSQHLELESNKVFYVIPDENDKVARKFLEKMPELKNFILNNFDISREMIKLNLKKAKKSIIRRKVNRLKEKIWNRMGKILPFLKKKPYKHTQQMETLL